MKYNVKIYEAPLEYTITAKTQDDAELQAVYAHNGGRFEHIHEIRTYKTCKECKNEYLAELTKCDNCN
jgi:hypothetical protein